MVKLSLFFSLLLGSFTILSINANQPLHIQKLQEKNEKKTNTIVFDMSRNNPITFGRVILGLGVIGLGYAGILHYASKTNPFSKDRFVAGEIRNLVLKVTIPVTLFGAVFTCAEKK